MCELSDLVVLIFVDSESLLVWHIGRIGREQIGQLLVVQLHVRNPHSVLRRSLQRRINSRQNTEMLLLLIRMKSDHKKIGCRNADIFRRTRDALVSVHYFLVVVAPRSNED